MTSIIEEIYYGNRGNAENIKPGKEYWEAHEEFIKIMGLLEEALPEDKKELLNKLFLQAGLLESEMAKAHYKDGFKTGLLMGIEVNK